MQAALDAPRHVIVSTRVSPMVELARWLFEIHRIPYDEEAHAPLLHILATRRRRGGNEVPVVVTGESTWKGAREMIYGLDSKLRPGEGIFGDNAATRQANQELVERLLERLVLTVRRYTYYFMLARPRVLKPIATQAAPWWEAFLVRAFYPLWRSAMGRGLDFSPEKIKEAPTEIREAFHIVEKELVKRRTAFLGGSEPGAVDIVFASLVAPLILPANYGARLPAIEDLPDELRAFTLELRARRAGKLALDTYAIARTPPQARMARRSYSRPLLQRLLTPGIQRFGARVAVKFGRPIVLPFVKIVVAARWQDVQHVLHNDLKFQIAPVNGPRFDQINGPFILGLDRGSQFASERPIVYRAMSAVDLDEVRRRVQVEATRLLDAAEKDESRIDISHGYAHLVAARTAVYLFGIAGPTEADLMRVIRAIFYHGFLNFTNDAAVAERGRLAFQDLKTWIFAEITRRRQHGIVIDDVLGRIMLAGAAAPVPLDDDGVRRNLSGLLVGSIDTTTTTVSRIIAVFGSDRSMLARVERDTQDRARMLGWCYEALRMWPDAPLVVRRATADAQLRGCPIRKDSLVAAFAQAAMFDGDIFPEPNRVEPTRPLQQYIVFGGGLHPCAGRAVNNVQVPELVRLLVERGIRSVASPRFDGPFVDELLVDFGRQRA